MPMNLTPQQLAAIMGAGQYTTMEDRQRALAATGLSGKPMEYRQSQNWQYSDPNSPENSGQYLGAPIDQIVQEINGSASNTWDPKTGQYTGASSGMSEGMQTLIALTMLAGGAAGAYGAGAGAGAGTGGVTAGGTAGGSITGLTAGEIAGTNAAATAGLSGQVAATLPGTFELGGAAASGGLLGGAGLGGGTDALGGEGLTTGGPGGGYTSAAADSQAANLGGAGYANAAPASVDLGALGGGSTAAGGAFGGLSYGDWAKLAGGLLGAAGSGDKSQSSTQTREPWGPAQDWIKQNITQGQGLQQQYTQNPFSQLQKDVYSNQYGLLNSANQNMPAWMQGMQANASGANNYDRNNPRRGLLGGGQVTMPQLGLLSPNFKFGG